MALVVESVSSNSTSNASTLAVTKPTGTVEGDLLILAMSVQPGGTSTASGFTLIEEFYQNNPGAVQDSETAIYYKIAGSSEPASYTVSSGAGQTGAAVIYRISGWTSGNPVQGIGTSGGSHDAASGTLTITQTVSRPSASLIISATTHYGNNDVTLSNYAITTSGSNPTWTEGFEVAGFTIASGTITGSFASAYANDSDTSDITAFTQDFSSTTSGDPEGWAGIFIVLVEPLNVSCDVSSTITTPTVTSVTATQVNTSPGLDHVDAEPAISGVEGVATAPTQWTNESEESTTWTNESL